MPENIRNAAISRLISLNYNPETAPAIVDAVLEVFSRANPQELKDVIICQGELTINTGRKEVFFKDGKLPITTMEYHLLEYLARNAGRVLSIEEILQGVWNTPAANASYIRVFVNQLRKKTFHDIIKTRRGFGYYMERGADQ